MTDYDRQNRDLFLSLLTKVRIVVWIWIGNGGPTVKFIFNFNLPEKLLFLALTRAAKLIIILLLLADMPKFFNLGPTQRLCYGPGFRQRATPP